MRAFNVLRQYAEDEVPAAWALVQERLAPDGLLVDGTCDEIGRRAAWVAVDAQGPVSLTLSLRMGGLERPSDVAERLPKSLIHRNVPGEPVHAFLADLDRAWARHAPQSSWGARQRFLAAGRRGAPSAGRCSTGRPGGASVRSPSAGPLSRPARADPADARMPPGGPDGIRSVT